MHPNDTKLFHQNPVSATNSTSINKKLHIYQYGKFFISTENDNAIDQRNIYYTLRAINILRYRFPKAYEKLYVETGSFATDRPKFAEWSNSNIAFWIAYNDTPTFIAKSYTSFVNWQGFPDVSPLTPGSRRRTINRYKNIVVTDIHAQNIMGNSPTIGSRPVYRTFWDEDGNRSAEFFYTFYMKDGLIETLVHEMLHRYIDYSYTFDEKTNKIRANRVDNNGNEIKDFTLAEEIAVVNTSLSYFLREGGLHEEVSFYYFREVFNPNIRTLTDKNLLIPFGKVFSDTVITSNNHRDVFRLSILD